VLIRFHSIHQVTSLVKDVATDVEKACSAVQETSDTANIILKDVVTATKVISSFKNDNIDSHGLVSAT
jgi:hypothetical protein